MEAFQDGIDTSVTLPEVSVRPYPPSWVNRLIWAVERLPGSAWAWYVSAAIIGIVGSNAQGWLGGKPPVGEWDLTYSYYGVLIVALVAAMAWLDRVAHGAMDTFRPAVPADREQLDDLEYELTVIPSRPVWVMTVAMFLLTPFYYMADPVGTHTDQLSGAALSVRFVAESITSVLFLVLAYHTLRQLRAVDRMHRLVRTVDLFQPAPLYAFSTLTFRTAMVLLGLLFSSVLVDPATWADVSPVLVLPWGIGIAALAVAAFVLPLRSMHAMLLREKTRLLSECGRRVTEVTAAVHRSVDTNDLSRADGLNKLLASLVVERDMVGKLSTWPWQPGQLGAIISAVALPILLFVATRMLDKVV